LAVGIDQPVLQFPRKLDNVSAGNVEDGEYEPVHLGVDVVSELWTFYRRLVGWDEYQAGSVEARLVHVYYVLKYFNPTVLMRFCAKRMEYLVIGRTYLKIVAQSSIAYPGCDDLCQPRCGGMVGQLVRPVFTDLCLVSKPTDT
jgi:hypothetical protein